MPSINQCQNTSSRKAGRLLKTARRYPLALVFILLMGTGLFLIVTRIKQNTVLSENRKPAVYPGWPTRYESWRLFPRQFEDALNDRFPFRNDLVFLYKRSAYHLFRHSTHPDVWVGSPGWLFYGGAQSMDDFRGWVPLAQAEIDRTVASLLKMNQDAQRQGSRFLFVIVPDKQAVYPEFLPTSIREGHPHRIDQLVGALQSTDLPFLDLRPALMKAKERGETLYYRYDTHWNEVGAFYGFAAILTKLGLPALRREDVKFDDLPQAKLKDMAVNMLGLKELPETDRQFVSLQYDGRIASPVPESPKSRTPVFDAIYENSNGNKKTILVVRDSFGAGLQSYWGAVFSRVRSVWPYYLGTPCVVTPEMMAEEKPDYVVYLMVQRNLVAIP